VNKKATVVKETVVGDASVEVVEKKKRAPANKKETVVGDAVVGDVSGEVVEKKKRAPAKKKETVVGDVSGEVVEKKKRAPAKKKEMVAEVAVVPVSVVAEVAVVPVSVPVPVVEVSVPVVAEVADVSVVAEVAEVADVSVVAEVAVADVHVCAVAMKCKGDCGVCVEASRLNVDGECDGCAHKSEILKKEVAKEVAKAAKEVAKAAKEDAKKAKEVAKEDAKKAKEVAKADAKADAKAAKKVAKKMVASAADMDDTDDVTVIMAPSVSPVQSGRHDDVFLADVELNVERVIINGVSFLIGENDIAYLESSKKMVGKYDVKDHSIRQMYSSEYDEYYGASDDEHSDDDECPV